MDGVYAAALATDVDSRPLLDDEANAVEAAAPAYKATRGFYLYSWAIEAS